MSGKQYQAGKLPKNIRQIGTNMGNTRIYLEDYVYTYLHGMEEQEDWTHRGFLLLGRFEHEQNYTRYFISGLIRLNDEYFKDDIPQFDDETWAYIYQEMKKYYDELEIVGWGQEIGGSAAGLISELERNHKQNFNIQKNVMLLLDHVEQEDAFYVFEKNVLQRKEGYYVYYEKNPQMQEYMIQTSKESELKIDTEQLNEPDAAIDYREILQMRKSQMSSKKWNGILYTTSMLLVLSVCVLGVSMVNNVEKMQHLENKVDHISEDERQNNAEIAAMSQNAQVENQTAETTSNELEQDANQNAEGSEQDSDQNTEESEQDSKQNSNQNKSETDTDASDTDDNTGNETDVNEELSSDSLPEKENSREETQLTEAQTWLLQGYYIVKKGDSLVGISQRIYGTTQKVDRICELNGIEDEDRIYEGQKLLLP